MHPDKSELKVSTRVTPYVKFRIILCGQRFKEANFANGSDLVYHRKLAIHSHNDDEMKLLTNSTIIHHQTSGNSRSNGAKLIEVMTTTTIMNGGTEATKQQQENPRGQDEVQEKFGPILKEGGKIYRKSQVGYLRPAKKGESISTEINGIHETSNTVKDDTSWIACGISGEQYILTKENIMESYEENSAKPIDESALSSNQEVLECLKREGFQQYVSKRSVYAHIVDSNDMTWFHNLEKKNNAATEPEPSFAYFMAPWGEASRVELGDLIVMKYPNDNPEIYRIEKSVFGQTYTPRNEV